MIDKAAIIKTIEVLDREIQTLQRAKQELSRQLQDGNKPQPLVQRAPRGSVKAFLEDVIGVVPKTLDQILAAAQERGLPAHKESLRAAVKRGVKKGTFVETEDGWTKPE